MQLGQSADVRQRRRHCETPATCKQINPGWQSLMAEQVAPSWPTTPLGQSQVVLLGPVT
jgi:hypothetical protein